MPNLLLHTCCGPCATYSVEQWRGEGLEVAALWFNPNIHPRGEHVKRRQGMEGLARALELPLSIGEGDVTDYFRLVGRDRAGRCAHCFYLRLGETARAAREGGFDAFSTTLLISPYQKHNLLREVAEEASRQWRVRFLYRDLRPGYSRSRHLARQHGLYRQNYCGCIYSLQERLSAAGRPARDEGALVRAVPKLGVDASLRSPSETSESDTLFGQHDSHDSPVTLSEGLRTPSESVAKGLRPYPVAWSFPR